MVCSKCNSTVIDGAAFCSVCGEKISERQTEDGIKYCSVCGQAVKKENKFCGRCGTAVGAVIQHGVKSNASLKQSSGGRIKGSYFVSVIDAIITFIIRISIQGTHYSWENALRNRKVIGIDSDIKPLLTAIPVIAAVIAVLLIVSDKIAAQQKKTAAFIINAVFIALAILFIWFDMPYAIFDF